jgi:hypothetical protein
MQNNGNNYMIMRRPATWEIITCHKAVSFIHEHCYFGKHEYGSTDFWQLTFGNCPKLSFNEEG